MNECGAPSTASGQMFVVDGVLAWAFALGRAGFWIPFPTVIVAAFSPVVYSLFYYKQSERRGEV